MKRKDDLTLGRFLSCLQLLTQPHFRSQVEFLAILFATYHDEMSDRIHGVYRISQSTCSLIFSDRRPIPRGAYVIYTDFDEGDRMLRGDVEGLLEAVIGSNRQRETYISHIEKLVAKSTNLDPIDKKYIIDYASCVTDSERLNELVFRTLRILIREPVGKSTK